MSEFIPPSLNPATSGKVRKAPRNRGFSFAGPRLKPWPFVLPSTFHGYGEDLPLKTETVYSLSNLGCRIIISEVEGQSDKRDLRRGGHVPENMLQNQRSASYGLRKISPFPQCENHVDALPGFLREMHGFLAIQKQLPRKRRRAFTRRNRR